MHEELWWHAWVELWGIIGLDYFMTHTYPEWLP